MHEIEQKLYLFLEQACEGKAAFSEDLVQEFGERCKDILRKGFKEELQEDRKFFLRMSNIGRPLRQLMLQKLHGSTYKPNPQAKIKFTIGHMLEAFFLVLLKQSGVNVIDHDKRVELQTGDSKLYGTYDVKIDGKIYDIKTASPYAYENKFSSIEALRSGDSFGYFAQGFGYSLADDSPFGGWIAINKSTGDFTVLDIPKYDHDRLREEYHAQILSTVTYVNGDNPAPKCCGVVDEYFGKNKTGNKILNSDCTFCDFKYIACHKDNIQTLPDVNSKAKTPKIKHYIGAIIRKLNASEGN